jgi:membrane-associated phospholipid phosphatase
MRHVRVIYSPVTVAEDPIVSVSSAREPGQNMRTRSRVRTVIWLVFGAVLAASTADADVVTDWNSAALNAIRAGRTPPPIASRALAMLHVAIYDAINGISRTHEAYRVQSAVPRSASKEAAAATAAFKVLVALFPSNADLFGSLYATELAAVLDGPQKNAGIAWGEQVGTEVVLWRSNDNSDATIPLPSVGTLGSWQPTPPSFAPYLLPQWAFVAPFAMPTSSFFRPIGPPPLNSTQYARDYNEVKALGAEAGSLRTPEQDVIALFWADGAGTETPPGHWNTIAQGVALRFDNTIEQNARLFALLNIAMADAAIAAWDAKYVFYSWRPVTAIRSGDNDGNAATVGDPTWSSRIGTPPFPEYVSGHSTFSAAAATILALFYGSDEIAFAARSDILIGVTRQFDSFSAAAAEAAISRLFGGIHFRSGIEDGLTAGTAIGQWTFTHYMATKGNLSRK